MVGWEGYQEASADDNRLYKKIVEVYLLGSIPVASYHLVKEEAIR